MRKKFTAMIIITLVAICLILATCRRERSEPVIPWGDPPATGTFSGTGYGFFVKRVKTGFCIERGNIVEVDIDLSGETQGIVERVPGRVEALILGSNSFDFPPNVVAGATRTIEAIIAIGTEALLTIDGVTEEDITWQWKPVEGDRGSWFVRPFPGQVH